MVSEHAQDPGKRDCSSDIPDQAIPAYHFERFHAKLLYSSAFRAPNIANSIDNTSSLNVPNSTGSTFRIKREKARILELELGGKPLAGLALTANGFAQVVDDIIEFNPEYEYYTKNGGKMGSMGVEAQAEYKMGFYDGLINASYVKPGLYTLEDGAVARKALEGYTYLTPDGKNRLIGVPALKLYTSHSFAIGRWFVADVNMLLYSERYQFRYDDASGEPYARRLSPQAVVGLGVRAQDIGLKGLGAKLGVHDLFNEELMYVSVFDTYFYSAHPFFSVKYKGREISLDVTFDF